MMLGHIDIRCSLCECAPGGCDKRSGCPDQRDGRSIAMQAIIRDYQLGTPMILEPVTRQRWLCSYCLGWRTSETCEGCGAPRHDAPAAPVIPRQPRDNSCMPQPASQRT